MWNSTKKVVREMKKEQSVLLQKVYDLEQLMQILSVQNKKSHEFFHRIVTEKTAEINEKFDELLKNQNITTTDVKTDVLHTVREYSDCVLDCIANEKTKITDRLDTINNDNLQMVKNTLNVESTLKQIIDYLMALDEGNRLIIAKLLLGEMRR